jgi:hypothetical protein
MDLFDVSIAEVLSEGISDTSQSLELSPLRGSFILYVESFYVYATRSG